MPAKFAAILLLFVFIVNSALCETIILPQDTLIIDDSAFQGSHAITRVIVPEGAERIGSLAFSNCPALAQIVIPASVTHIAPDAFDGCHSPLLIETVPGSAAMRYARTSQLDFSADTQYRALLIGEANYDTYEDLPGAKTDAAAMASMLGQYGYETSLRVDLTADEIHEAIQSCFASAQEQDVSLLYYSGHGIFTQNSERLGAMCGVDGEAVTGAQLRSWLDTVPGRKVVILDSCYSGNLIGRGRSMADRLVSDLIAPFRVKARSGELATADYFVMTAAQSTQESYELEYSDGTSVGIFTSSLTKVCGYNAVSKTFCERTADENGDGVITLLEAYQHARTAATEIYNAQTAQVYPADCSWFGFLRSAE